MTDDGDLRGRPPRPRIGALDISDDEIATMVHVFYARVRKDAVLAPLFDVVRPEAWPPHMATMRDFWSSILRASGRYKGAPMAVHLPMTHLQLGDFERWLALFQDTVEQLFDADKAKVIVGKAENIARSLHLGISSHRGEISGWDPSQRPKLAELEP